MGVCESLAARIDAPLEQIVAELLELSPCEGLYEVFRNTVNRHDVRKVDFGRRHVGELDLGLLSSLFQSLESHRVLLEVGAVVLGSEL